MNNWTWVNWMALLNTVINFSSGWVILAGVRAIKRGDRETHQKRMLTATAMQAVFLVLYLTRHAIAGETKFVGPDLWRYVYYLILFPHLIIATAQVPFILRAIYLGLKGRFQEHRRLVRIVTPLWLYVAFSGAVVFLMLHIRF
jgi:putative membrane protein